MKSQGTINEAIEQGVKKRKSLKVVSRYLRMKYNISISSSTLKSRKEKMKVSYS